MRKFISILLSFILACCLIFPASASSDIEYTQRTTFWHWIAGDGSILHDFAGYLVGSVCSQSEDGYHHASSYVQDKGNGYYTAICSACGKKFEAYESDLKQSYQQQVADLPAPGIGSDGALYFSPTSHYTAFGQYNSSFFCPHYIGTSGKTPQYNYSGSCDSLSYRIWPLSGDSQFWFGGISCYFDFTTPIDGYYYVSSMASGSGYYKASASGSPTDFKLSRGWPFSDGVYYEAGNSISCWASLRCESSGYTKIVSAEAQFTYPIIKVIPFESGFEGSNQYNINFRPTTITGGNYGIVGDDGQIITINNPTKIINEGDNIYYNPATGQTYTITDWTYNYDGRIYNITLDTGDKVSVEYGDENITITENTINEGDTIVNNYTIYYIIDGSGDNPSPSPDPGPTATTCPHSWKEVSRTEPTCTSPGSVSCSCSKCGETKTDKLPATGHTWQVLRTVQTAYDEEGNLVQQGYTIYQCAVCSEQYKDDQGTGPPGGGDKDDDKETIWDKIANFFGSIVDGIAGIFEAILGKLLDALTALSELLMGKVKDVVEVVLSVFDELPALFGGFLDFLGVVFPFLPPEITLLLTFGVIAVVFIGIIKAIRR